MTPEARQAIEHFHRQHRPDPDWLLELKAEEPELFGYHVPTRGELRALHPRWILWGRPLLVFADDNRAARLLEDLDALDRRSRSTVKIADDRDKAEEFRKIMWKVRRTWSQLVELATGMRVMISIAPVTWSTIPLRDA